MSEYLQDISNVPVEDRDLQTYRGAKMQHRPTPQRLFR